MRCSVDTRLRQKGNDGEERELTYSMASGGESLLSTRTSDIALSTLGCAPIYLLFKR